MIVSQSAIMGKTKILASAEAVNKGEERRLVEISRVCPVGGLLSKPNAVVTIIE
jgi:hypothetical protein